MGAKSKHYAEVAAWVQDVIVSCKTSEQLAGAYNLIINYRTLYHTDKSDIIWRILLDLNWMWDMKQIRLNEPSK